MAKKPVSSLNSDITVTLDGADYELRASLKAAATISRQFGGINNAFGPLRNADIDAYAFIIRAGLTKESLRDLSDNDTDIGEAVWRTGMDNLAEPLSRYVNVLRNGGRDPEEIALDEDDAEKNDGIHV